MKRAANMSDDGVQKVVKRQAKEDMGNRATFSLGDVSALQALKDKMENK